MKFSIRKIVEEEARPIRLLELVASVLFILLLLVVSNEALATFFLGTVSGGLTLYGFEELLQKIRSKR